MADMVKTTSFNAFDLKRLKTKLPSELNKFGGNLDQHIGTLLKRNQDATKLAKIFTNMIQPKSSITLLDSSSGNDNSVSSDSEDCFKGNNNNKDQNDD